MDSRTITFFAAAALLVVARIVEWVTQRRAKTSPSSEAKRVLDWSAWQLLLASFLTLFAELALIRWIAVELWIFAYFKNLALLLCFLGFGLGCALAGQTVRWSSALKAFLFVLLLVRVPWNEGTLLKMVSPMLGGANDAAFWSAPNAMGWSYFLAAAAFSGCIFVLIVLVFVPLGQVLSQQIDRAARPLHGYSLNLFGSLVGVAIFFLVSSWMIPPVIWMGVVLLGFALLQSDRKHALFVASLLVPLALLVQDPTQQGTQIHWTPYQQIQYRREYTRKGELRGGFLQINHTFYQQTLNLSPEFLARNPELGSESDYTRYNVPFQFARPSPKVLVVGSGTGNDVAGALRHGASSIDAVEIDPAIIGLGKREHPEHPYDSPKVRVLLTDARNFLKRTDQHYDLILFGLLDSHVQFSDFANVRIDNFVYTEEAFREAAQLLTPEGVLFVKFRVERDWMGTRLREILDQALSSPALVFRAEADYSGGATCFVASRNNRIRDVLSTDRKLAEFVNANPASFGEATVPVTTDDWPYLYQKDHRIPRIYYSVGLLVIVVALAFYASVRRRTGAPSRFFLFFFSMGAGFLLLETQIISRIALFFGTIWQVNGIVISALLIALLLANLIVERKQLAPKAWIWAGLVASLMFAYWFPFDRITASSTVAGIVAICIFSIPVVFAGMLFSSAFKDAPSPSAALNANVLGSVTGGLLENLSLTFGLRALLLIAIVLYCMAGVGLWRGKARVEAEA